MLKAVQQSANAKNFIARTSHNKSSPGTLTQMPAQNRTGPLPESRSTAGPFPSPFTTPFVRAR